MNMCPKWVIEVPHQGGNVKAYGVTESYLDSVIERAPKGDGVDPYNDEGTVTENWENILNHVEKDLHTLLRFDSLKEMADYLEAESWRFAHEGLKVRTQIINTLQSYSCRAAVRAWTTQPTADVVFPPTRERCVAERIVYRVMEEAGKFAPPDPEVFDVLLDELAGFVREEYSDG